MTIFGVFTKLTSFCPFLPTKLTNFTKTTIYNTFTHFTPYDTFITQNNNLLEFDPIVDLVTFDPLLTHYKAL